MSSDRIVMMIVESSVKITPNRQVPKHPEKAVPHNCETELMGKAQGDGSDCVWDGASARRGGRGNVRGIPRKQDAITSTL